MDLDCTQQGILFSDERKNIQQPVFALGVLDTLPCFGIRHMQVVGVKVLSAGQKHSSPRPRGGGGEPRGAVDGPSAPGEEKQHPQRGSHLGHPPPRLSGRRLLPPPAVCALGRSSGSRRPRGAR